MGRRPRCAAISGRGTRDVTPEADVRNGFPTGKPHACSNARRRPATGGLRPFPKRPHLGHHGPVVHRNARRDRHPHRHHQSGGHLLVDKRADRAIAVRHRNRRLGMRTRSVVSINSSHTRPPVHQRLMPRRIRRERARHHQQPAAHHRQPSTGGSPQKHGNRVLQSVRNGTVLSAFRKKEPIFGVSSGL